MPTVKLPGIGDVETKYVWSGAAVVGVIVAYAYYKRSHAAATASTAATTTPDPNSIDPATGITYGEEAAAAAAGSSGSAGYNNPNPAASGYNSVSGVSTISTNLDWSNAVTTALETLGYDSGFIGSTLGKYLAGQPLTADEAALIRTAWAYVGKPPSGSTGINLGGTTTPPAGTTTPPAAVKRLATTYLTRGPAAKTGGVLLSWTPVSGAKEYHLHKNGALIGNYTTGHAQVNKHGVYTVSAIPAQAGVTGSISNPVTV